MQRRFALVGLISSTLMCVAQADNAPAAPAAPAPEYTFTGNVSLTSDYIFRGITQTNNHPAIQGGFDFAHKSGFYLGTWGSSISWLSDANAGSLPMEWDIYGGYKGNITDDIGFDVGVLEYYYPGTRNAGVTNPDTTEIYGAVSYKFASLKYSYATSDLFGFTSSTGGNTHGSGYVDLTVSPDLGDGWGLVAHAGHQDVAHRSSASYDDWKLGVTKDVGVGSLALTYTDTNAKGKVGQDYYNAYGKNIGRARAVISFTKTM